MFCQRCLRSEPPMPAFGQYQDVGSHELNVTHPNGISVLEWFEIPRQKYVHDCIVCHLAGHKQRMLKTFVQIELPSWLLIGIISVQVRLESHFDLSSGSDVKRMRLAGLIYHSGLRNHFTAVVVDRDGNLWYHNGMTTRNRSTWMKNMQNITDTRTLHCLGGDRILCAAIYCEKDRT